MATHSSILARKSHEQRRLVGYSSWGHKESDTTEHACMHAHNTLCSWKMEVFREKCQGLGVQEFAMVPKSTQWVRGISAPGFGHNIS